MAVSRRKISAIAEDIRHGRKSGKQTSFILGTGASIAAGIPSAAKLVEEINRDFGYRLHRVPADRLKHYGECMHALTPEQRETLIQPKLDDARIDWGQIALASLLKHGFVSRILTFNFDLVLEKAVSLLGMQVPVYDFAAAPSRNIHQIAAQSIVHLHGQSSGLVLLNGKEETRNHKARLHPVISDKVRTRNTIVFGYSGEAAQDMSRRGDPGGHTSGRRQRSISCPNSTRASSAQALASQTGLPGQARQ